MDKLLLAGELYTDAYQTVQRGEFMEKLLARHIPVVLDFDGDVGEPLWKDRIMPSDKKRITLEKFEDYLFKKPRAGLGLHGYWWLKQIIDAHVDAAEREKAFAALRNEIPNFDDRVANDRAKAKSSAVGNASTHGGKREGSGRKAADAISEIEPANVVRGDKSRDKVSLENSRKRKSQFSPERIIARLKRDAETDGKAKSLLQSLEAADVSPRKAALEMGYIKPTKSVPVDSPVIAIRALLKTWTWEELNNALQEVKNG